VGFACPHAEQITCRLHLKIEPGKNLEHSKLHNNHGLWLHDQAEYTALRIGSVALITKKAGGQGVLARYIRTVVR